ncbi:MAG: hypothetical protein E7253_07835 [Lachnospiraceae bacterium]|nr:hypothetical protein [Lachnospiraceae bacterium]
MARGKNFNPAMLQSRAREQSKQVKPSKTQSCHAQSREREQDKELSAVPVGTIHIYQSENPQTIDFLT